MNVSQLLKEFDSEFWASLALVDEAEALRVQQEGCPYCGGKLHCADYPRKPRGGVCDEGKHVRRYSFCCEKCRKRVTPKSVRFLGRKVYVAVAVVLTCYLRQRRDRVAVKQLVGMFGMSEVTIRRWLSWWQDSVLPSSFWQGVKGLFMPPLAEERLISLLCERFQATQSGVQDALRKLLSFLSPLTIPDWYPS